jgi:hypothetical protein
MIPEIMRDVTLVNEKAAGEVVYTVIVRSIIIGNCLYCNEHIHQSYARLWSGGPVGRSLPKTDDILSSGKLILLDFVML